MNTHRSHRAEHLKARIWLVFIFLFLSVYEFTLLSATRVRHDQAIIGGIAVDSIWFLVLLVAIWFRQSWARYFLAGTLLIGAAVAFISDAVMPDLDVGGYSILRLILYIAGHVAAAVIILCSHSIKRLTSRSYT